MFLLIQLLGAVAAVAAAPTNLQTVDAVDNVSDIVDTRFASPDGMCNVTLVIGSQELKVSKEFLAVHSPIFAKLFAGNITEKVEIADVDYDEFVSLMQIIFPGRSKISDATVLQILQLADQFQIERVLDLAETHLLSTAAFPIAKKFQLADQFKLPALKDKCLHSYEYMSEFKHLKFTAEYATFSDSLKASICDRMLDLKASIIEDKFA
ncbi:hypothetical protein PENTCL1PPCAC_24781 [Pristionchus entomophagus]|uniref:BTB domain-containing protein n=1 Tax=Pristionchus entomophagus TaxID=358040 RepID=A0AAV5U895_9BILA|nr:hypothetical protein PENTCL1PPCAC_24781 [Pristionchus entomophagus]